VNALHALTLRPDGRLDGWIPVCPWDDLVPDRGVCALVAGEAVAVFRCSFGERLYAVDDLDPFTGASVLSRGLVGMTADGTPFVASPLRRQRFDLRSGVSLDDPAVSVRAWPVRVGDGQVHVAVDPFVSTTSSGGNDRETPS
jgi:nitrite reductase (NADH) small subunit